MLQQSLHDDSVPGRRSEDRDGDEDGVLTIMILIYYELHTGRGEDRRILEVVAGVQAVPFVRSFTVSRHHCLEVCPKGVDGICWCAWG